MWKVDKGSLTGTTTAIYTNALDWGVEEMREKTIILKNTHATASLKYKLLVYAAATGIAGEEIAETTLGAGETAKIQLTKQWARLVLQVIDGSGHATYQVDYIGQGA
jgi:5,10-methenyltetrahydromethanopterin hydrogenase